MKCRFYVSIWSSPIQWLDLSEFESAMRYKIVLFSWHPSKFNINSPKCLKSIMFFFLWFKNEIFYYLNICIFKGNMAQNNEFYLPQYLEVGEWLLKLLVKDFISGVEDWTGTAQSKACNPSYLVHFHHFHHLTVD